MNSALALPLHLLELSLSDLVARPALAMASAEELTKNMLGEVLSEQELQTTKDMFAQASSGTIGAAAIFRSINNLAWTIEKKGLQPSQIAASSAMSSLLKDIRMLRVISRSQFVDHVDIQLENIALFQYISSMDIEPALGEPEMVIIGALPQSVIKHDITVSPKNDTYIERRTEIVYGSTLPYPRLNLRLRSRRGSLDVKNARFDWPQRPFPEYDLELCTFQERLMGSIQTRYRDLPYTVVGKKLSITIPKEVDTNILETSILDEKGNALLRCVRIVTVQEALVRQA
jgi:hypothetical protein